MKGAYDADQDLSDGLLRAKNWPSAFARLATAAGVWIGRSAVGFVGLAVVVGAMVPRPEADGRISRSSDLAESTVTLGAPEGQAGRLSVVDEAGRELAVLTRWSDGEVGVVARCGAVGVCCWLKEAAGTAFVNLIGKERETHIEVQPDGTMKAATGGLSGHPQGHGPRPDGPRAMNPRARTAMIHHALDGQPCQLALDPRS